MPKLYETCHELDVIINLDYGNGVNVETGEFFENVAEKIAELNIEKDRLLKYFCGIHRDTKADIKKFDDEIERLTKQRDALKNYDKGIVSYVTYCLNGEKWKQDGFSVYYGTAQDSVDVNIEPKFLPVNYVNVEYVPKKKDLLNLAMVNAKVNLENKINSLNQTLSSNISLYNQEKDKFSEKQKQPSKICRICYGDDNTDKNPLIYPCKCSGSMKFIHYECLKTWLTNQTAASALGGYDIFPK